MINKLRVTLLTAGFILLYLMPGDTIAFQTTKIPELKITSIKVGDTFLFEKDWDNFSVSKGSDVLVNFAQMNAIPGVLYRVHLDGVVIASDYEKNSYLLSGLNNGVHIFRIVPYTPDLKDGTPIAFSFVVRNEMAKPELSQITDQSKPNSIFSQEIIYAICGLVVIQLIVIIILIIQKKGTPSPLKVDKSNSQQEINELKRAHKKVLEELKNQYAENENLHQKIKELDSDIASLENANTRLVEQKEKLSESKHKLEILHAQKEELFAMAIHDIKNPASAISGYIELLNSYDLNATEQHEIMVSLVETSANIVQMSQNMCSLIAQSMPEPKYKMKPFSVNQIIEDVCLQNGSYAKSKKVILKNSCQSSLPDVNIDPEKIEEALDNLVNNAIKYAPPETKIEVRSFIKDLNKKYIAVEVKDNGVGISEEDLKKSFQKGVVLTPKPTGLEQSSGLGLWIVKKIIEEHNGRVYVNSKEGVGSTFGFELPMD